MFWLCCGLVGHAVSYMQFSARKVLLQTSDQKLIAFCISLFAKLVLIALWIQQMHSVSSSFDIGCEQGISFGLLDAQRRIISPWRLLLTF